jgi:MarR family transcriptional regulator, organic hydroperoxide resistance regulator
LPEQEPLARLIGAARRAIKLAVGRRLQKHGLSPQRFWILVNLQEAPGLSLRGLAARLRIDEPTASRMVAALVRQGLIRMEESPADRRRRHLALTREGESVAKRVRPIAEEVRRAAEAGMSAEEKDTLRRLLQRVMWNIASLESKAKEKGAGRLPRADGA